MRVVTFIITVFFGSSWSLILIVAMASGHSFAFSRVPFWRSCRWIIGSSFLHYIAESENKDKSHEGQLQVDRKHFLCFLVFDKMELSHLSAHKETVARLASASYTRKANSFVMSKAANVGGSREPLAWSVTTVCMLLLLITTIDVNDPSS